MNLQTLALGAAASYGAAFFNQPKFPKALKLLIVLLACTAAACFQQWQKGALVWPPSLEQIAILWASAGVAYHGALKHLGADWLERSITPDNFKSVYETLFPVWGEESGKSPEQRLRELENIKGSLTEEEYTDKRKEILKEV